MGLSKNSRQIGEHNAAIAIYFCDHKTPSPNCRTLADTKPRNASTNFTSIVQFQMSMAPGELCQFSYRGHGLRYSTEYKPGFYLDRIY